MDAPSTARLHDLIDVVDAASPGPLDRLGDAVRLAGELGETADALVGHYVDQARRSGATWTQIGASMGVSKQAAQQRFVTGAARPASPAASAAPADQGFHRFTDEARAVVVAAQHLAQENHDDRIALVHLVLALLGDGRGPAADLVEAAGVDVAEAVRVATATLPAGVAPSPALVPFDDRCKQVLQRSFAEAARLGQDLVDAPHLLLAVLAVEDGTGVLAGLGLRHEAVGEALRRSDRS